MVCSLQTCQASAHAEGSVRAPFTNTSRAFDSSNAASPTYELLQLGHWRVSFSTYTVRTRPLAGSATQLNDEHPDTCDGCTERATGYTNHRKGVRYQRTHVYPGGCSGLVRLLRCTHGACDTAARSGGASPSPTRSRCHFSASNHSLLRVHHPTSHMETQAVGGFQGCTGTASHREKVWGRTLLGLGRGRLYALTRHATCASLLVPVHAHGHTSDLGSSTPSPHTRHGVTMALLASASAGDIY